MTAVVEPFPRGGERRLPPAPEGRFRPVRAGIRNVWEYDDQEFWFEEGRLILRGPNTAGKSKALELLFPFVLDGETRPERLDPFGARSKTMYWNLIDFDPQRRSAIGYCWAEFGRRDPSGEEEFVTAIAGLRATRSAGKRVETWFAVTSLRVGAELDLAPDGRPLTADRLAAALADRGRVERTARDHRAGVDRALFGLGPERYEALVHLLLQLRRPKLSEKLDPAKLAEVLTDSLPPLARDAVDRLAQAFARLDADTAEIEALERAHAELGDFVGVYRRYAQVQARLRADAVRSCQTRLDKVTETERVQRGERDSATTNLARIEAQRVELEAAEADARGRLEGLDLSKVHALEQIVARAAEAEGRATQARSAASEQERVAAAASVRADVAAADAAESVRRGTVAEAACTAAAVDAGLEMVHASHAAALGLDPEPSHAALDGFAGRRVEDLRTLRAAAAAAEAARAQVDQAETRHADAVDAAIDAGADATAVAEAALAAADAYAESVDGWRARLDGGVQAALAALPADLGDAACAAAEAAGHEPASERGPLDAVVAAARDRVTAARAAAGAEAGRLSAERHEVGRRLADERAERADAPPPRPGRPVRREGDAAALWRCVDFAPTISTEQGAALEAALEASGLLDAAVTPAGTLADEALDTVVTGAPVDGPTLADVLVVDPAGPLSAAAVQRALRSVGLGAGSGADCWIDVSGEWANGPLHGRWTKNAAEHVGESARATARARRIAGLEAELATLDARVRECQVEERAQASLDAAISAADAAFPPPSAWRDARRDAAAAALASQQAEEQAAAAATALARARTEAAPVLAALAEAEAVAGIEAHDVDTVLDAVADYRRVLAGASGAIQRALHDAAAAATAAEGAAHESRRAAAATADAAVAERRAAERRGEAAELRAATGADVAAVLARKGDLDAMLAAALERQRGLLAERDLVRDRLAAADALLARTEAERHQRDDERTAALAALAHVAGTELVAVAGLPVDPARDVKAVTAGLAFARHVFERLKEVDVTKAACDRTENDLHRSFSLLRERLGTAHDPHLDTSDGLQLCYATLNGRAVGAAELEAVLGEQIRRRRETLTTEERELIEHHLLREVGSHLADRIHAAWNLVRVMNEQLASHPTSSGVTLRLEWVPDPEAGQGAAAALKLLRRDVALLDAEERAGLAAYLAERVRASREGVEGADAVERLAAALDYRNWHRFVVHRRSAEGEVRFTSRSQGTGSGGEQAKLAHLPLFAATAAYYRSARADAPRLLMLDEAFAGIDEAQRGDCFGMLVDLDLDFAVTNYAEWGCHAQVPRVATYHLERTDGVLGVTALRFVWDGRARIEDDPFVAATLDARDRGTLLR